MNVFINDKIVCLYNVREEYISGSTHILKLSCPILFCYKVLNIKVNITKKLNKIIL